MSRFSPALAALSAFAALALAAPTAFAQQQIESRVPLAFNRFYDSAQLAQAMRQIALSYPHLVSIEEIGKSAEGRPLLVATLFNPNTGPIDSKPAMWIDGNVHGNEIQAAETVLYTLWYLASAYGQVPEVTKLVDRFVFYLMPSVNPDGRDSWFHDPHSSHSSRTGRAPFDDDRDGVADEDGPDDLNGDGSIGRMFRRDPNGTHRRNIDDPRILERVEREVLPDGTVRKGEWSMAGSEGIDNDGDGEANEDGPGGYDMNRSWPADWQPDHLQHGAGRWPLCWPETRAIADFILARPKIAAVQSYHNAGGMILRGPGHATRDSAYPPRDQATYKRIQDAGAEMLPFYKVMVTHSDLYPVRGGFTDWTAESLGIVSLTNELWTDKRILQDGKDPDDAAQMRWNDRVLLGQAFNGWTEVPHPQFGTVLVGGSNKWSSRIPPPFMIEEEAHRNFAFTMFHANNMPLLRVADLTAKRLGPDLWQVEIQVANDRLIPTRTARAASAKIGLPDRLRLRSDCATVLASGAIENAVDRTLDDTRARPELLLVDEGIPGVGTRSFRFLVGGKPGCLLHLTYEAEKAATLTAEVALPE